MMFRTLVVICRLYKVQWLECFETFEKCMQIKHHATCRKVVVINTNHDSKRKRYESHIASAELIEKSTVALEFAGTRQELDTWIRDTGTCISYKKNTD